MSTHVMLAIESMGTGSFAAIVAIGAVKFNPMAPTIDVGGFGSPTVSTFYIGVTLKSSMAAGLQVDADTIMWWLEQSAKARKALTKPKIAVALDEALLGLSEWYGDDTNTPVWGNSSALDCVIVRNAYGRVGIDCPWHYRSERCLHTIKYLRPAVARPDYGIARNALDDAISQALWLQKIVKEKGLVL